MAQNDLRAEIEKLHREIAELRSERTPRPNNATVKEQETHSSFVPSAADLIAQFHALADEISTFIEDPEQGIADHPLASILGAFVIGLLVGRRLNR